VCAARYPDLIPDVEQEVRLALLKRLRGEGEIRHPSAYVYKVALATSLAVIRRYRPQREELEADPERSLGQARRTLMGLLPAERSRLIEQLVASLEPDAARALRGYLTGLNHGELAQLYGWTPSVARHLVYRSVERLRRELGDTRGER
jgi:RNA polymerase sigma factor (sigma-70 family)